MRVVRPILVGDEALCEGEWLPFPSIIIHDGVHENFRT